MTISRSSWFVLFFAGAAMAPAVLLAQGVDSTRTHVVRPGDTLWRLAIDYLGDAKRWREILALNSSAVVAPESLAVGSRIRIPAGLAMSPSATTEAAVSPPTPTPVSTSAAAPPSTPARDSARRTIFFGARPVGGFVSLDSSGMRRTDTGVTAGVFEAVSAPFVADPATLDGAGRCVALGDSSSTSAGGVMLYGKVLMRAPTGATASPGSRWILVRRGPVVDGLGQLAIPTGLVRVATTGDAGAPATAAVTAQFESISCADAVLPYVPPLMPDARPVPVANGPAGRIAWVTSESLLPTLQHVLILDIGASHGVHVGDRVTVYAAGSDSAVANAAVVRVDQGSATALVVRQTRGTLATGLRVRVTEKLP